MTHSHLTVELKLSQVLDTIDLLIFFIWHTSLAVDHYEWVRGINHHFLQFLDKNCSLYDKVRV